MRVAAALSVALAMVALLMGQAPPPAGIAVDHPGDRGIASDRRVVFADDFDAGSVGDIARRWTEASDPGGRVLALGDDVPAGSAGPHSLRITATPGEDTGGHLYRVLPEPLDDAYLRFYVKFLEPANYIHHFVTLGGYHPSTRWPQGGAGERPVGDDRVTVGIEPFGQWGQSEPPGIWNFYCYWHEMKVSAGGRYWGNALTAAVPPRVPAGRWQCVEMRLRLNSAPGVRDGLLTLWLDGERVAHFEQGVPRTPWSGMGFALADEGGEPFEGFAWRDSDALKINFLWLMLYVTEENLARSGVTPRPETVSVLFDQVVVAREYIGPLVPVPPSGAP